MKSILRHRIIGLALAGIFTAFNVGLPVVVASCPMMKYSDSSACMGCDDGSSTGTSRFTNAVDKSCCETKYASDRNKNEFLQAQKHSFDTVKLFAVLVPVLLPQTVISNPQSVLSSDTSPPRSLDIPILISSLLI